MNKRQFKKLKSKQFYECVGSIKKDEIAVLTFDMDKISPMVLQQFTERFKKTIDNNFVLLPKDKIQFVKSLGKEEAIKSLQSFVDYLNKSNLYD